MRYRAKIATLLAAGSLFLVGAAAQALANSAQTDAFVTGVRPNVDFLDRSSRMALGKTRNRGLRAFAHSEAVEQTIAANSLVAWTQANTLAGAGVALGSPAVAAANPAPVVQAPLDAATAGAGVVTGRSVAEDRPLTVTRAPRELSVSGPGDSLAQLSALEGRQFDFQYVATQRDSLRQLAILYADYARQGDDPGLRALATRELPKINRRLAELRRF